MEKYIEGNKEAWEEAFSLRAPEWGADIVERIQNEEYAFFNEDTKKVLRKYDLRAKSIGQFCSNNGRELLSLVKSAGASEGIGFDIAENQVRFANEKAAESGLPCSFVATNILDIDDSYKGRFDMALITIGALCWLKDLNSYFKIVSKCLKENGVIVINEQHPFTNMLANGGDAEYDSAHPLNCCFSYFEHEWIGNDGMQYITKKAYKSKTFTDYTHSIAEIVTAMCENGFAITGMQEFDYDISAGFDELSGKEFPLSLILEGRKISRLEQE